MAENFNPSATWTYLTVTCYWCCHVPGTGDIPTFTTANYRRYSIYQGRMAVRPSWPSWLGHIRRGGMRWDEMNDTNGRWHLEISPVTTPRWPTDRRGRPRLTTADQRPRDQAIHHDVTRCMTSRALTDLFVRLSTCVREITRRVLLLLLLLLQFYIIHNLYLRNIYNTAVKGFFVLPRTLSDLFSSGKNTKS